MEWRRTRREPGSEGGRRGRRGAELASLTVSRAGGEARVWAAALASPLLLLWTAVDCCGWEDGEMDQQTPLGSCHSPPSPDTPWWMLRCALRSTQKPNSSSPCRMVSSSSSTPPTTLEAALVRISHLEATLLGIAQVVRRKTGVELEEFLQEGGKESLAARLYSPLPPAPSPPSSLAAPTPKPDPTTTAEEPFDITRLVLKALVIRKNLASGALGDEEGEEEVIKLCEGLSAEHQRQVRDWAGTV